MTPVNSKNRSKVSTWNRDLRRNSPNFLIITHMNLWKSTEQYDKNSRRFIIYIHFYVFMYSLGQNMSGCRFRTTTTMSSQDTGPRLCSYISLDDFSMFSPPAQPTFKCKALTDFPECSSEDVTVNELKQETDNGSVNMICCDSHKILIFLTAF